MADKASILPANSTPLERALEQSTARVADVSIDTISKLWNPETCPVELLPWLAWALSTDSWNPEWSEDQKRQAVADAIQLQRRKGTRASIESVLARFDKLLTLTEWFEYPVPRQPHTFTITLPLTTEETVGGERATAAFVDAIVRDVIRTKPARSHFDLLQTLEAAGQVGVVSAAQTAGWVRVDAQADEAAANNPVWATYLTTETGEPLTLEDGTTFLEAAA